MTAPAAPRHLVIILSTPPSVGDVPRVTRLAHAARRRGLDVSLFCMADAVHFGADPRAAVLLDAGCDVVLCSTNAVAAHVAALPGVLLGSQDDHAALVHRATTVVSFT